MKMIKKLLSILLCIFMLTGLFPVSVFAEDEPDVVLAEGMVMETDGDTVTISAPEPKPETVTAPEAEPETDPAEGSAAEPAPEGITEEGGEAAEAIGAADTAKAAAAPAGGDASGALDSAAPDEAAAAYSSETDKNTEADEAGSDAEEPSYPAFDRSRTVNGVTVRLSAPEGVFPEGAELSVTAVPSARVEAAVAAERDENANVAVSYTFDIKVMLDGGELQPADEALVKVSFALAQANDSNLDATIYHISDGEASALDTTAAGGQVSAETDGFSLYTVEFTYNTLEYVLSGGGSVKLETILSAVGLTGEAEAASVSDASLFSVSNETGEWIVTSHRAFTTTEWLRVTIAGVEYEITVTDDPGAVSYVDASGAAQTPVTEYTAVTASTTTWTTGWYVVDANTSISTRIEITGAVNLILCNGVTLTASKGIHLTGTNSLTIWAQSMSATMGKLTTGTPDNSQAGIGGNENQNGGIVTVNGGTVTAQGGKWAAGIGGGEGGGGSSITINGGKVTATGGSDGAGIGGGGWGETGTVTITGGSVTADGGGRSAGIGSGCGGYGGSILITGGTVKATGAEAGIGGGAGADGADVTITGGTVTAKSGSDDNQQAIGHGSDYNGTYTLKSGALTITGMRVTSPAGTLAGERLDKCRANGSVTLKVCGTHTAGEDGLCKWCGGLLGSGRETDPYLIPGEAAWNALADLAVTAEATSGLYFKQTADISVTTEIPVFAGTYDGGGHALTVAISGEGSAAPFHSVSGAAVRHLAVTGTVSGGMHCAGLVGGVVGGQNVISDCVIDVSVTGSGTHCGGVVGHAGSYEMNIMSCVFTGGISGAGTAGTFWGWSDSGASGGLAYCLDLSESVHPVGRGAGSLATVNTYYTRSGKISDGSRAWSSANQGKLAYPVTAVSGIDPGFQQTLDLDSVAAGLTGSIPGLKRGDTIYAAEGENLKLVLSVPGASDVSFSASAGTLTETADGCTFTMPASAVTISASAPIPYVDARGNDMSTRNCQLLYPTADTWVTGWYVVNTDMQIDTRIEITGDVNLILCDGCTLTAPKGINVGEGNSLTIYGQTGGTGALFAGTTDGTDATCDTHLAGIGGDNGQTAGAINLYGGTVTAAGGFYGAGIGGGDYGDGGTITVVGSDLTAAGGAGAAGVGGGYGYGGNGGDGGTITITDSAVTASGGENGAGIGGGSGGDGGDVTISGGTVSATGGLGAAGVGGGYGYGGNGGDGGTITITGCDLTAIGGDSGAGIGGGYKGDGGTITITGGTVIASGGDSGAGVGGGYGYGGKGGSGVKITITDCDLTATGGMDAAGIGGGQYGNGGEITITGGTVIATGVGCGAGIGGGLGNNGGGDSGSITITDCELTATSGGAAGIGGGMNGNGETITITGGTVTATGGTNGAGIGGGNGYNKGGDGGTITITDCELTATGGDSAAGIGGGYKGDGGDVTISGGTVTAIAGSGGAEAIGCGVNGDSDSSDLSIPGMRVYASEDGDPVPALQRKDACRGGWVKLSPCTAHEYENRVCKWCEAVLLEDVAYVDPTDPDEPNKTAACVLLTNNEETLALTGGWYAVDGDVTIGNENGFERIEISGDVHIILADGCTLSTGGVKAAPGGSLTIWGQTESSGALIADGRYTFTPGIECTDASVTINGGTVTANGDSSGAGIGGGDNGAGGTVTINGGAVTAKGEDGAAGIGGGFMGSGGEITITGGTVTATGGAGGAGIGGGYAGSGGTITITDGAVTAVGSRVSNGPGRYFCSAGIGGGHYGSGGEITITGGTVTASCFDGGQAIGHGTNSGESGILSIPGMRAYASEDGDPVPALQRKNACRGGWVKLTACDSHIDSSGNGLCDLCGVCGPVAYQDPTDPNEPSKTCDTYTVLTDQTALDSGWYVVNADAAIPERITVSGDVNLILCDGTTLTVPRGITVEGESSLTVWAQSDAEEAGSSAGSLFAGTTDGTDSTCEGNRAGIGSDQAAAGKITVNGGFVTAVGCYQSRGAGLGGNQSHPCSLITINGGVVTAKGGQWAAGIGNGPDNSGTEAGRVVITGGTVTATATYRAAGIGGGMNGTAPDVLITGGTVTATGSSSNGSCPGIGGGINRTNGAVTITGGTVTAVPGSGAQAIGSAAGWSGEPGPLTITGMRVTTPAGTPADGREAACRASAAVTLTVCTAHEIENGACKWCGADIGAVPYLDPTDAAEPEKSCDTYTVLTGQTALTSGWYVVNADVEISRRITVTGDVKLILTDGCTLNAVKGVNVSGGNSLTIYGQSGDGGTLTAFGDGGAGIGGNTYAGCGSITINGGTINASVDGTTSGSRGAAIGGGRSRDNGVITINGGIVTARANGTSSAIGGGGAWNAGNPAGAGGTILITGGTVTASATYGAAIGGGGATTVNTNGGAPGSITITGGTVTASARDGAAIGSGEGNTVAGGTITITGGTVTADCINSSSQAIGHGKDSDDSVSLRIDGMKVYASEDAADPVPAAQRKDTCHSTRVKLEVCDPHSYDEQLGVCEYCGESGGPVAYVDPTDPNEPNKTAVCVPLTNDGTGRIDLTEGWYALIENVDRIFTFTVTGSVNLILCDGCTLNDTGGIIVNPGSSLTIWGQTEGSGTLSADGVSNHEPGIQNTDASVTINGGTVIATGADQCAGIGGLYEYDVFETIESCGTVTVNGGTVAATGGLDAAGIGSGVMGDCSVITITGGTVTAIAGSGAQAIGRGSGIGSSGILIIDGMKVTDPAGTLAGGRIDACRGERVTLEVCAAHKIENGACKWCGAVFSPVPYLDPTDEADPDKTCDTYTVLTDRTELTSGWYVVNSGVTISGRVTVTGEVHVILTDGATLTVPKGITVEEGNSLTIWGQTGGTGALFSGTTDGSDAPCTAAWAGIGSAAARAGAITINGGRVNARGGNDRGAGIGGNQFYSCTTVAINGGEVSAVGGRYAAGIGNGPDNTGADVGKVTITGGSVRATNVGQGAGIGGGTNGAAPEVEIRGGTVNATGGERGAGIGGGNGGAGGIITISGGTVTATGGQSTNSTYGGAGIGGGEGGSGGIITISGGVVEAVGGERGAGIGSGGNYNMTGITGGTIRITGGEVTATGHFRGAGIGGGCSADGGTVTIEGGTVTATGDSGGAGIGGGGAKNENKGAGHGGVITISGGTVNAVSAGNGAGIGGGGGTGASADYMNGGHGGVITITGGTVTAASSGRGAGIGGGNHGDGVEITISGDSTVVTASSATMGAGIGGGNVGAGGVITISGGTVTATGGSDGNSGGAGIGGGSWRSGGSVTVSGGTVTAIAGTSSQAIGFGDSYGYTGAPLSSGELTLGSELRVTAGANEAGASPVAAADRYNACRQNAWARVSPCGHGESAVTFTETGHTVSCAYCGTEQVNEAHYGGTATTKEQAVCDVCHQHYGPYAASTFIVTIPATAVIGADAEVSIHDVDINVPDAGKRVTVTAADTSVTLTSDADPSETVVTEVTFPALSAGDGETVSQIIGFTAPDAAAGHYTGTMRFNIALG